MPALCQQVCLPSPTYHVPAAQTIYLMRLSGDVPLVAPRSGRTSHCMRWRIGRAVASARGPTGYACKTSSPARRSPLDGCHRRALEHVVVAEEADAARQRPSEEGVGSDRVEARGSVPTELVTAGSKVGAAMEREAAERSMPSRLSLLAHPRSPDRLAPLCVVHQPPADRHAHQQEDDHSHAQVKCCDRKEGRPCAFLLALSLTVDKLMRDACSMYSCMYYSEVQLVV